VAAGTTVSIDGSTSMVLINEALKAGFMQQYPGTQVNTAAVGSENGIQALLLGDIDVAASSRPLTAQEQANGLVAVPVTTDRMALVVGNDNPYRRGLSTGQVAQIFQGQITNWSALGGPDATIRVINRPSVSGTHAAFREMVLKGGDFGTTPNITTLDRDATTPLLQQLGTDGIGYATFSQVADQQTVRVVPVDGVTPEAANYPLQRPLYYVYKDANSPAVQAFLGFALSPQGQQAIAAAGN
jgi:phosphate transport system substrate-binding protein